jgi:hypothetical protein
MLNQNNITTCLLLLQQHINLQHKLNNYCELLAITYANLDLIGISDDLQIYADLEIDDDLDISTNLANTIATISSNLDYVEGDLTTARSNNAIIIAELKALLTAFKLAAKSSVH